MQSSRVVLVLRNVCMCIPVCIYISVGQTWKKYLRLNPNLNRPIGNSLYAHVEHSTPHVCGAFSGMIRAGTRRGGFFLGLQEQQGTRPQYKGKENVEEGRTDCAERLFRLRSCARKI